MPSLEFTPKLTSTSAAWLRSRGNSARLRIPARRDARTEFRSGLAIHASEKCEITGLMTTREEKIRPVLIVSALNGWSVILLAGLCAIAALFLGSWYGFIVGAAITASEGWRLLAARN